MARSPYPPKPEVYERLMQDTRGNIAAAVLSSPSLKGYRFRARKLTWYQCEDLNSDITYTALLACNSWKPDGGCALFSWVVHCVGKRLHAWPWFGDRYSDETQERRRRALEDVEQLWGHDLYLNLDDEDAVERPLARLPRSVRNAVRDVWINDKTYADASRDNDVPVNTLIKYLKKAIPVYQKVTL